VPPELGCCPGGATPPLFGSTPPPLVLGVPLLGVCGEDDGGVLVPFDGVLVEGVPPLLGVPPVAPPDVPPDEFWFFLFFFLSAGVTGWPVETGGITGCTVCVVPEPLLPPPPPEAIAITTIRKKAAPVTATSLRRR
jgi:hypothetical protein